MKKMTRFFLGVTALSVMSLLTWQTLFARDIVCPPGYIDIGGICVPADEEWTEPQHWEADTERLTCSHGNDCFVYYRWASCLNETEDYCYPESKIFYDGCSQH